MATAAVMNAEDWVPVIGFGDRLRVVRRRKHRTQDEMAALLGVKKVTYASWEAGIATPPHGDVVQLARKLYDIDRVPQWWTMGADEPRPSSFGSEGWGFESLRVHPFRQVGPVRRRRADRRRQSSVVPLRLATAA